MTSRDPSFRRAMTLVELLVVVGVVVLLAGVLLAALTAVKGSGNLADSQNRLRQIGIWVQSYATDNRETVLPSRFDYRGNPYQGKVRSNDEVFYGEPHLGTWTDILWTIHEVGAFPSYDDAAQPLGHDYRFDSPDSALYAAIPEYDDNPFRSAAPNSHNVNNGSGPTPYGDGAKEKGEPGYFAANDFFDASSNVWWTMGQIRAPDRSLYVIDSFGGETISGGPAMGEGSTDDPFDLSIPPSEPGSTQQVDLRYNGLCLMLFLDGHVQPESPWIDLQDLEEGRKIRVRNLHLNQ